MPPRSEEELDPVTLHNQALITDSPTQSFEKLQFLLQQVQWPPETFSNLLLFYVKHEVWDLFTTVSHNTVELLILSYWCTTPHP